MTLQEFYQTYNGQSVMNGQCVGLVVKFQREVQNFPNATYQGNAIDYYTHYSTKPFLFENYDLIPYNGKNLPIPNDIVVWNDNYGQGYGHIAIIYDNINSNSFDSIDQNWQWDNKTYLENHSYRNVLGFLRLKGTQPTPTPTDINRKKFPWQVFLKNIRKRRI